MKKWLLAASAVALSVGALGLLSRVVDAKAKTYPACTNHPTVAVDQFRTENIYIGYDEFSGNARDVVVNELTNSGCFKVVERGGIGVGSGYEREQFLRGSGRARRGQRVARGGGVTLASRLVQFALTGVSKDNIGGSFGGLGGLGHGGFGLGNVAPKTTNIRMTCRIYDSSTSEVLASSEVSKTKFDIGVTGAGAGNIGLGGDFFYKSPAGKAIADMIHDCSVQLAERSQNIRE